MYLLNIQVYQEYHGFSTSGHIRNHHANYHKIVLGSGCYTKVYVYDSTEIHPYEKYNHIVCYDNYMKISFGIDPGI